MSDAADRGAQLTGSLLAFSERQSLTPQVFDAADRVQWISGMLASVLGRGIILKLDVCERAPVEVDVAQFDMALINLSVSQLMSGVGARRSFPRDHDG